MSLTPSPNCPACGSPRIITFDEAKVSRAAQLAGVGFPSSLRKMIKKHGIVSACNDCKALWEPLPPGEPRHPEEPLMSFVEPCDNCAFRPGSPEVEDKAKWKELLATLKEGGRFYCHKGVPLGGEHGFQYPTKRVTFNGVEAEIEDVDRMRLCRGFLNAWAKWEGFD